MCGDVPWAVRHRWHTCGSSHRYQVSARGLVSCWPGWLLRQTIRVAGNSFGYPPTGHIWADECRHLCLWHRRPTVCSTVQQYSSRTWTHPWDYGTTAESLHISTTRDPALRYYCDISVTSLSEGYCSNLMSLLRRHALYCFCFQLPVSLWCKSIPLATSAHVSSIYISDCNKN